MKSQLTSGSNQKPKVRTETVQAKLYDSRKDEAAKPELKNKRFGEVKVKNDSQGKKQKEERELKNALIKKPICKCREASVKPKTEAKIQEKKNARIVATDRGRFLEIQRVTFPVNHSPRNTLLDSKATVLQKKNSTTKAVSDTRFCARMPAPPTGAPRKITKLPPVCVTKIDGSCSTLPTSICTTFRRPVLPQIQNAATKDRNLVPVPPPGAPTKTNYRYRMLSTTSNGGNPSPQLTSTCSPFRYPVCPQIPTTNRKVNRN